MDKQHLRSLQAKVKKLMQQSSDDSDEQPHLQKTFLTDTHGDNPETVRKCITLINQNRQLKALLEREKRKNQKIAQQLVKVRQQKSQIERNYHDRLLELRKSENTDSLKDQMRKAFKLENETQDWKRKYKHLDELLKLQRKKCNKLTNFIRREIPKMQETITILTAKVDSKLEAHLLKQFDI